MVDVIEGFAIALLCLALLTSFSRQRRLERRLAQQGSALRRLLQQNQPPNLAPDAPHWNDVVPPLRQHISVRPAQRRIDRAANPGTPTVREHPPVIRETPGWQYADDPEPPKYPYQPKPEPRADKETLRRGYDKRIRRQRSE